MKKIIALLTAVLLSSQAQAIQISAAGDSFTVDWRKAGEDVRRMAGDLTATSTWLVSSYSSDRIVLDISITNTTAPINEMMASSGITRFGFGMLARATGSVLGDGSLFDSLYSGWGMQLVYPGGGNRLNPGATDSLQLQLSGDFRRSVNLMLFPMTIKAKHRHHLLLGKASKVVTPADCLATESDDCTPANVPEPAVAALVLLGLAGIAGMGGLQRRKRQPASLQG